MRLVVADTGPLNYLILIDAVDVLPHLFVKVSAPEAVRDELMNPDAPVAVRAWIAKLPGWLEVCRVSPDADTFPASRALDPGERAALALARGLGADLILMDDRAGVAVALEQGFAVTGTLGILDLAARRGLVDIAAAFERLRSTNFRFPPAIMDALLAQHAKGPAAR